MSQDDFPYASTGYYGEHEALTEAASPLRRILAVFLNIILTIAAFIPFSLAYKKGIEKAQVGIPIDRLPPEAQEQIRWHAMHSPLAEAGLFLFGIYCIAQLVYTLKSGRSAGKRIVGIQVVGMNGHEAGIGRMLLREGSWFVPCLLLITGQPTYTLYLLAASALAAAAGILFFPHAARCSWQDRLAGTQVVKYMKDDYSR